MAEFHDTQPIFVQIRERIAGMILAGEAGEGDPLPSVRTIATELSVNPLTVGRAFDGLVDLGVVESRRGLGMFVAPGARERLLSHERGKFLAEEWPRIRARIGALGLDAETLLKDAGNE